MIEPPTPDSTATWLLGLIFGSPSLVVSTFLIFNAIWAWWSLGRSAVATASSVFNRTNDKIGLKTMKVRGTFRLAIAWTLFYGAASVVTQIWAGSQFSPGQGGGLGELVQWSVIFGVIAVLGCLYITPAKGPKHTDPGWAPYWGLFGGYALGLLWALFAFTLKGGPDPGDWWVCPALSCIGVLGSAFRMRIRANEPARPAPR